MVSGKMNVEINLLYKRLEGCLMKRFLKRNMIVIIILLVFGTIFLYEDYQLMKDYQKTADTRNYYIERCKTETITDEKEKNFCHEILTNKVIDPDFYSGFSDVLVWYVQPFAYFLFLIVIIPPMIPICKMLRNKYIMNTNLRESYRNFIKKMLFTAYKYLWILPVLAIVLMIPLLMNYSLTPEYSIVYNYGWNTNLIYYPVLFLALYLLNVVIVSMIYVNISLVVARFQHKFIPCIILSYIVFFALEIFLETVVRVIILQRIFHTELGMIFNIMDIFGFNDLYGIGSLFLVNISFLVISFVFVYLVYKNKEKLVIQCEKNK